MDSTLSFDLNYSKELEGTSAQMAPVSQEDGIGRDSTFEFDAEELRDLMMPSFDGGERFKYCDSNRYIAVVERIS